MPTISEIKDDALVSVWDNDRQDTRPVVAVSLGCHINGYSLPHPDPRDRDTVEKGIKKRFLSLPPKADTKLLRELQQFVRRFCEKNLTPFPATTEISFSKWLDQTNYPLWRKKQLQELYDKLGEEGCKYETNVKAFVKDEHYLTYKHARLINARSDGFKCYSGPLFSAIEKEVFSLPYFIKKIPMDQRGRYITELIYKDGAVYMATDYTAFETHFTPEMMNACEFELYRYMTENTDMSAKMGHIMSVLSGVNHIFGRNFKVELRGTRMSGEMNTSLGNGFSNLMFMLFILEKSGCSSVTGIIEGDDGLFSFVGPVPTPKDFARLGLNIKLEVHEFLNEASFCGMIFDTDSCIPIADPYKVLTSFGWTKAKYACASQKKLLGLLRSKSLNVLYQYQNAPIFQALARYGLRHTQGIRAYDDFSSYWAEYARDAKEFYNKQGRYYLDAEVPMSARLLMERKFGLTVEMQIKIENYLDTTELGPLRLDAITYNLPEVWYEYNSLYSAQLPTSINHSRCLIRVIDT